LGGKLHLKLNICGTFVQNTPKMYFATAFVLFLAVTGAYSKDDSRELLFKKRCRSPKVYLALGDSIPAGTRDEIPGPVMSEPFGELNYPNIFNQLLGKRGFDQVINLSCPRESTENMLDGNKGDPMSPDGSLCYGDNAPLAPTLSLNGNTSSQLNAAKYILANYNVGLLTITLGSNDMIQNCVQTGLAGAAFVACANKQYDVVKFNLKNILDELSSLDTSIPILISNYYSPFLAFQLPGTPLFLRQIFPLYAEANAGTNFAIADGVESSLGKNMALVDLESAFDSFDISGKPLPRNVLTICQNTYMCGKDESNKWVYGTPNADVHPNKKGHIKVAKTFYKAYDDMQRDK